MLSRIRQFIGEGFCSNCYCIESCGEYAIIDPGCATEEMLSFAEKHKSDIKYILLTHTHFDHTCGAKSVLDICDAKLCVHSNDVIGLTDADYNASGLNDATVPPMTPDIILNDGDILTLGDEKITVMNTPGHTAGSVCYLVADNMFCGDTLFADGFGRTDLPGGSMGALVKSLRKLFKLDKDYTVYPGHGPATTLYHEKQNYAAFR